MNEEERGFWYKNYYMDFDTFIEYLIEKCKSRNEKEIEKLKDLMYENGYSLKEVNQIITLIIRSGHITKQQIEYIKKRDDTF